MKSWPTVRATLVSGGAYLGLSGVALAATLPAEPMVSPGSASTVVVLGAVGWLLREARGLAAELVKARPTVHLVHHQSAGPPPGAV